MASGGEQGRYPQAEVASYAEAKYAEDVCKETKVSVERNDRCIQLSVSESTCTHVSVRRRDKYLTGPGEREMLCFQCWGRWQNVGIISNSAITCTYLHQLHLPGGIDMLAGVFFVSEKALGAPA